MTLCILHVLPNKYMAVLGSFYKKLRISRPTGLNCHIIYYLMKIGNKSYVPSLNCHQI